MERKLIIIAKNDIRNLTFDEVFNMYEAFIKKMAEKWAMQYEYDDMKQIASVALWKAFENYDSSTTVGFGSVATVYISRALLKHNQLNKPKTENATSKVKSIVSIEEKICKNSDGKEITIQDALSREDLFTGQIIEKIALDGVISELSEKEKKHLSLIIQGYGTTELAQIENIKPGAMSMRRVSLFKKMRALYIENGNLNYTGMAI